MVGVREHQMPNEQELAFLIRWIRSHYPTHGIEELSYAFELGLNDRLDIDDMKSYGAFSIQYLADVMNSYRRLLQYIKKNETPKPIERKALMAPVLTLEDKRKEVEEFAATTKLKFHLYPLYIYDYLDELGLVAHSQEDESRRMRKAEQARLGQIFGDAASGSKDARQELKDFKQALATGTLDTQQKNMIERISKRVAISEYLKQYHDTHQENDPRHQQAKPKQPKGGKHRHSKAADEDIPTGRKEDNSTGIQ